MRSLCLFAALATVGTFAVACGSSESGGGTEEVRTVTSAATVSDQIVENPAAIGSGYHSDTGHSTSSCWDVPSPIPEKYTDVQLVDTVIADHSWSSDRELALRKLHADLQADAEFDLIEADVTTSYDDTKASTKASDVLTLRIFIETIDVNFLEPEALNTTKCTGTQDDPMRLDEFLRACGDRFISGKDFGGYLIFTAAKTDMTEAEREEFSAQLKTDYSIGTGNLSGYAKTLELMEKAGFEFRAVSRGFTNILAAVTSDPSKPVSPSKILNELAAMRSKWASNATAGTFPSDSYGVTIDQTMSRYTRESNLYERCTGVPFGQGLICFDGYMNSTKGKLRTYRTWEHIVGTPLDDAANYYWGATTGQANENKADYQRVRDLLNDCMSRINGIAHECDQVAKSQSRDPATDVCAACADGEPPYNCSPSQEDDTKCGYDTSVERQQCTIENLHAAVTSLSDGVIHKSELPANKRISSPATQNQHEKSAQILGYTRDTVCALAGFSGELASMDENVRLRQSKAEWIFSVDSKRTGNEHMLTGRAWCVKQSYFFDRGSGKFTVHGNNRAESGRNPAVFKDKNGRVVDQKYAVALNGVQGNFASAGEKATAQHDRMELRYWSNHGKKKIYGTAFGLDDPYDGTIDRGLQTGSEVSVSTKMAPALNLVEKPLIKVSDGFCFLHHVGGEFDGTQESAKVYQKDKKWWVAVSSLCTDLEGWDVTSDGPCTARKPIAATATCYKYDQTK